VASGVDPVTATKTLGTVFGDVVAGDGGGSTTAEGRVVLVTDQKVRVFKDGRLSEAPGQVLGTYPPGTGVLSQNNRQVTFPDGEIVEFSASSEAKRVIEPAGGQ
jgi:hypothetical protein